MSLIAAYAFNEEGLNDYSGNKKNLTNNGVTFSATTANNGGFGYDAIFGSGINAYNTSFPNPGLLSGLTIFFNVYITSFASTIHIATVNPSWDVQITTAGKVRFYIENTSGTALFCPSNTTLSTNTWYTIACVWDSSVPQTYVYINGELDNQADGWSALKTGGGSLYVGNPLAGNLNMLEIRSRAFSASEILSLNQTPGGNLYTVDLHNFAVGDLIADEATTNTGVVTWIQDASHFYAYPFVNPVLGRLSKYGNIYNSLRQYIMEISNDFDGNGNSQISVKYPIASFSDYNSPANIMTFDYRGLSGSPSSNANSMAITSLRI